MTASIIIVLLFVNVLYAMRAGPKGLVAQAGVMDVGAVIAAITPPSASIGHGLFEVRMLLLLLAGFAIFTLLFPLAIRRQEKVKFHNRLLLHYFILLGLLSITWAVFYG